MKEIVEKIRCLTDLELQEIMRAIEDRYSVAYPDWDVIYIAVHKDPELRRQEFGDIMKFIDMDIQLHQVKQGSPIESIAEI